MPVYVFDVVDMDGSTAGRAFRAPMEGQARFEHLEALMWSVHASTMRAAGGRLVRKAPHGWETMRKTRKTALWRAFCAFCGGALPSSV